MAFDYNEYMRKYNKEKIVAVTIKLHKEYDSDIIEALSNRNKSAAIKIYIRKAIGTYEKRS